MQERTARNVVDESEEWLGADASVWIEKLHGDSLEGTASVVASESSRTMESRCPMCGSMLSTELVMTF